MGRPRRVALGHAQLFPPAWAHATGGGGSRPPPRALRADEPSRPHRADSPTRSARPAESIRRDSVYDRSWASTATLTRAAPATRNARAASLAVLPVVSTSSTRSTVAPRHLAEGAARNAPRTLSRRALGATSVSFGVGRTRRSHR